MKEEKKKRIIEVLQMIADDAKADAARFDGQPFTGKTMAITSRIAKEIADAWSIHIPDPKLAW